MMVRRIALSVSIAATALLSGCSSTPEAGTAVDDRQRTFGVAIRQLPPEPPYHRLRFVHLPEMLPNPLPPQAQSELRTVMEFEVRNMTVQEAAQVLAASSRYSSYAASTVADTRVSLRMLGTLDEIAERIAEQAGAKAYVDHVGRSIRFVSGSYIAPQFFEDSAYEEARESS